MPKGQKGTSSKVIAICLYCKNESLTWPYRAKNRFYCSRKCQHDALRGGIPVIYKTCEVCKKEFQVPPTKAWIRTCSNVCGGIIRRKKIIKTCKGCTKDFETVNTGNKHFCSSECFIEFQRGENHPLWKGDQSGNNMRKRKITFFYDTIHKWVKRYYGSPQKCELCGLDEIPKGKKVYFDWANISGEYRRERSDWMRLCRGCHKVFDKK